MKCQTQKYESMNVIEETKADRLWYEVDADGDQCYLILWKGYLPPLEAQHEFGVLRPDVAVLCRGLDLLRQIAGEKEGHYFRS